MINLVVKQLNQLLYFELLPSYKYFNRVPSRSFLILHFDCYNLARAILFKNCQKQIASKSISLQFYGNKRNAGASTKKKDKMGLNSFVTISSRT